MKRQKYNDCTQSPEIDSVLFPLQLDMISLRIAVKAVKKNDIKKNVPNHKEQDKLTVMNKVSAFMLNNQPLSTISLTSEQNCG